MMGRLGELGGDYGLREVGESVTAVLGDPIRILLKVSRRAKQRPVKRTNQFDG